MVRLVELRGDCEAETDYSQRSVCEMWEDQMVDCVDGMALDGRVDAVGF